MSRISKQALQAIGLCRNVEFRRYLDQRVRLRHGLTTDQLPDGTHNERDARDAICRMCGIESRASLGHLSAADEMFARIRADFDRWCRKQAAEDPAWL